MTAYTRRVTLLRTDRLPERLPEAAERRRCVLFIGNEGGFNGFSERAARHLIDGGVRFVCCWGAQADEFEETFDYAAFLPECGPELAYTLMTTSHSNESFEDVLQFVFSFALDPGTGRPFDKIIALVDSTVLFDRFNAWLDAHPMQPIGVPFPHPFT